MYLRTRLVSLVARSWTPDIDPILEWLQYKQFQQFCLMDALLLFHSALR